MAKAIAVMRMALITVSACVFCATVTYRLASVLSDVDVRTDKKARTAFGASGSPTRCHQSSSFAFIAIASSLTTSCLRNYYANLSS